MSPVYVCCLSVTLLLIAGAHAGEEADLVNRLRERAGLGTLQIDPRLAEAARRHAAYLDRHREPGHTAQGVSAHQQLPERQGFSGASPADRAIAAGYPHHRVLENVSMGYEDAEQAIDGLMRAIYHRLTFLDLSADQLGAAVGQRSRVFLLGRSDISALCTSPPAEAGFRQPLDCLGRPMRREFYEDLCRRLPADALFRAPHPVACPDGTRLDAAFMQAVCKSPPVAARFGGHGRYYMPCDNGLRIDADWFLGVCDGRVPAALSGSSGDFYEICDGPQRVSAEWFEALCAELPTEARYRESLRYRRPCAESFDVRAEYFEQLDARRLRAAPPVVVWPPDGASDVPPAFFFEEPDPLPDHDVAGYPLSVQFNPGLVETVEMREFSLYRESAGVRDRIALTRLLDRRTDPHELLSDFEFVLFPLERLDWDTRYRVVVDVLLDGRPQRLEWAFTTRGGDIPLLLARSARQTFVVDRGVDYRLYLPPTDERALTVSSVRTEHRRGNRVDIDGIDGNTLRIRLEGHLCDRVRMRFDSGREVVLIPRGCAG